jgi:hypothetical protein
MEAAWSESSISYRGGTMQNVASWVFIVVRTSNLSLLGSIHLLRSIKVTSETKKLYYGKYV